MYMNDMNIQNVFLKWAEKLPNPIQAGGGGGGGGGGQKFFPCCAKTVSSILMKLSDF